MSEAVSALKAAEFTGGIAEVTLRGDRANEFRVAVNMPSLLSRGLTIFDVSTALQQPVSYTHLTLPTICSV